MSSTLTFHSIALTPVLNGLKNLRAFLAKAEKYIKDQGHDANDYLTAQLAPDMYNLIVQIQKLTDTAKSIAAKVNPENPSLTLQDEEKTFDQLYDRISRTIEYLEGIDPKSFEGREDVQLTMQFKKGAVEVEYSTSEYIVAFAHPNYWFHVTTAYDILRSKGVPLGKFDYLNGAGLKEIKIL